MRPNPFPHLCRRANPAAARRRPPLNTRPPLPSPFPAARPLGPGPIDGRRLLQDDLTLVLGLDASAATAGADLPGLVGTRGDAVWPSTNDPSLSVKLTNAGACERGVGRGRRGRGRRRRTRRLLLQAGKLAGGAPTTSLTLARVELS